MADNVMGVLLMVSFCACDVGWKGLSLTIVKELPPMSGTAFTTWLSSVAGRARLGTRNL
jgi:hypothetical protein